MSSVDISALGNLTPSQPLDFSKYPAPKAKTSGFTLAPAAEYNLRLITPVTNETLTKSQEGHLKFRFDAEIADGPYAGQKVRFQTASASVWTRDGVEQSFLGNLVMAAGGDSFPGIGEDGDPTPQVRAVEAIQGKVFRAYVTWLAKDRKYGSGTEIKGMKNFPIGEGGQPQSWFPVAGAVDDKGRPARVYANLEISNYVPAVR